MGLITDVKNWQIRPMDAIPWIPLSPYGASDNRRKAGEFRTIVFESCWLDKFQAVPDETIIADVLCAKSLHKINIFSVYHYGDEIAT